MVSLLRQSDFRSVQNLPFCYLCGRDFVADDSKNRDHVPPECIFAPLDREPLWLPEHTVCNGTYRLLDEKIGQLIALRYGNVPRNAAHRRLKFAYSRHHDLGAVVTHLQRCGRFVTPVQVFNLTHVYDATIPTQRRVT
jgi:hypothetical protein